MIRHHIGHQMKIEDFLKAIHYKISEGTKFQWECFGKNARIIDYGGEDPRYDISCTFDYITGEVFILDFYDYDREVEYRFINPNYRDAYDSEAKLRGIDPNDEHTDTDIKTIDIDLESDIMEKIKNAVEGREYDSRVTIEIDLPEDVLFSLMKMAHKKDITLNQLFEEILREAIAEEEKLSSMVDSLSSKV